MNRDQWVSFCSTMGSAAIQGACCAHIESCYFQFDLWPDTQWAKRSFWFTVKQRLQQSALVYTWHILEVMHETGIVSVYWSHKRQAIHQTPTWPVRTIDPPMFPVGNNQVAIKHQANQASDPNTLSQFLRVTKFISTWAKNSGKQRQRFKIF